MIKSLQREICVSHNIFQFVHHYFQACIKKEQKIKLILSYSRSVLNSTMVEKTRKLVMILFAFCLTLVLASAQDFQTRTFQQMPVESTFSCGDIDKLQVRGNKPNAIYYHPQFWALFVTLLIIKVNLCICFAYQAEQIDATTIGKCPEEEEPGNLVPTFVQGIAEANTKRHTYHRCNVNLLRMGYHCGMESHNSGKHLTFASKLLFIFYWNPIIAATFVKF